MIKISIQWELFFCETKDVNKTMVYNTKGCRKPWKFFI